MFEFVMSAYKYDRVGYTEIRMQYRINENDQWQILTEIIPRERFCEDKLFAQRTIDNLFDRARREVLNSIDTLMKI